MRRNGEPYPALMDSEPRPSIGPTRDRWIAMAAVGVAALLAAGWITRERQLATDLAESREDLRQAMHRLQTLTASTDQIRTAYLQRRSELEAAKKKIDQLALRQEEKKRESGALCARHCWPRRFPHTCSRAPRKRSRA